MEKSRAETGSICSEKLRGTSLDFPASSSVKGSRMRQLSIGRKQGNGKYPRQVECSGPVVVHGDVIDSLGHICKAAVGTSSCVAGGRMSSVMHSQVSNVEESSQIRTMEELHS